MPNLKGLKILIVDDEEVIREYIRDILEGAEVTVFEAESAVEALAFLAGTNVDLVISDFNMPGPTGLDLAKAIQGLNVSPVVILCTAFSIPALPSYVLAKIDKPFSYEDMIKCIAKVLGR